MRLQHVSTIALALALTACATGKPANVMPLTGGQYRTTGFGESENEAQGAALKAAEAACAKKSKGFEVASSQTKYKGVVSEATNRNVKAAGNLAAAFGKSLPGLSDEDDYEVSIVFACSN